MLQKIIVRIKPKDEKDTNENLEYLKDRDARETVLQQLTHSPSSVSSSAAEEKKKEQPVKTSGSHVSDVLSSLVVQQIVSYLDNREAHRFFVTSRHVRDVMRNKKGCINLTFGKILYIDMMSAAARGFAKYIISDKKTTKAFDTLVNKDHYNGNRTEYSKEYHQAECFSDILTSRDLNTLPIQLFALYVFLRSGGEESKSYTEKALSLYSGNFLKEIDTNVRQLFGNDTDLLAEMEKELLDIIHKEYINLLAKCAKRKEDTDPNVIHGFENFKNSENFDENDIPDFIHNFMKEYVDSLMVKYVYNLEKTLKSRLEESNAKSKKGGCCNIS